MERKWKTSPSPFKGECHGSVFKFFLVKEFKGEDCCSWTAVVLPQLHHFSKKWEMYLYKFWKCVPKYQEQECDSRIFRLKETKENYQVLNTDETSYLGTTGCLWFTLLDREYQMRSYFLSKSEFCFDTYIYCCMWQKAFNREQVQTLSIEVKIVINWKYVGAVLLMKH